MATIRCGLKAVNSRAAAAQKAERKRLYKQKDVTRIKQLKSIWANTVFAIILLSGCPSTNNDKNKG